MRDVSQCLKNQKYYFISTDGITALLLSVALAWVGMVYLINITFMFILGREGTQEGFLFFSDQPDIQ